MSNVPGLLIPRESKPKPSQAKIDALAADLSKLTAEPAIKVTAGNAAVPTFQRQGYLEKLGHTRMKWFKRFFVLRDSFLLSYNLQKSDYTTEPRSSIHLGNCKVALVAPDKSIERDFCFSISTETGDQFLFSASSDAERQAWLDDLMVARNITHATMVKLAVENQCLAEEKGLASVTRDVSTSALAIFSNPTYVQETPLTGGMEGWLSTAGFNSNFKAGGTVSSKKSAWKRSYFMLRDSHLLMFNAGDMLSKPRGVMYLVGTVVEALDDSDPEMPFRFVVGSQACGDMIELAASSQKSMNRWKQALQVGARVTYPDYRLLEKERQLLAAVVLTPRAPTPRGPGGTPEMREPPSVLEEEVDIMGNPLAPGAVQPYDENGVPLIRDPKGRLINPNTNEVLPPNAPRFSAEGEPLDAFNRPLPPNAVPMFNSTGVPIGVGPDGQHYTPDGELVDKFEAHFDSEGKKIDQEVVNAADLVAPTIAVAVKVRSMLKGDNAAPEVVDPLGRSFKALGSQDNDITEDGVVVPSSARRVEVGGKLVTYEEAVKMETVEKPAPVEETARLVITMEFDDKEQELGSVEVDNIVTLSQVRETISNDLHVKDFTFLVNGVPLTKLEEKSKLAIKFMPGLHIRGRELQTEAQAPQQKFTQKVTLLRMEQEKVQKEEAEFKNVMEAVQSKKFLKSVGRDLTK